MNDKSAKKHTFLMYGIPAGLLAGVVIAVAASLNIGISASIGMLAGIAIGAVVDSLREKKSGQLR